MNQKSFYYEVYFKCFCEIYISSEKKKLGDLVIVNCDYTSGQFNLGFIVRQATYDELKIDPQTGAKKKPTKVRSSVPIEDEESIKRMLVSKLSAENYVLSVAKLNIKGVKEGEVCEANELLAADFQYDRKKLKIFLKKNSGISICRLVRKLYQIFKVRIKIIEIEDIPKLINNMKTYGELSQLDVMNYDNFSVEESSLFLGSFEKSTTSSNNSNSNSIKSNSESDNNEIINPDIQTIQQYQSNYEQNYNDQQYLYSQQSLSSINEGNQEFYNILKSSINIYHSHSSLRNEYDHQKHHYQQPQQPQKQDEQLQHQEENNEGDFYFNKIPSQKNFHSQESKNNNNNDNVNVNIDNKSISSTEISQLNIDSEIFEPQFNHSNNQFLKSSVSWDTNQYYDHNTKRNNPNNSSFLNSKQSSAYPLSSSKSGDNFSYPPRPSFSSSSSMNSIYSISSTSSLSTTPSIISSRSYSHSPLPQEYQTYDQQKLHHQHHYHQPHQQSQQQQQQYPLSISNHNQFSSINSRNYHNYNDREPDSISDNYYPQSYLDPSNDNQYHQQISYNNNHNLNKHKHNHNHRNNNNNNNNNHNSPINIHSNYEVRNSNQSQNRTQGLYGSRQLNSRYNVQQSMDEISSTYSNNNRQSQHQNHHQNHHYHQNHHQNQKYY